MKSSSTPRKSNHQIIEHLNPSMIRMLLTRLCNEDDTIRTKVSEMIQEISNTIDHNEVADELLFGLKLLVVEDVWDRANESRYGYVSTEEAAMEMMEEELEPFREEVTNHINLKQPFAAQEQCKGILLGIYRFEHETKSQFKDWASDCAGELFKEQLEQWIKIDRSVDRRTEMYDFIEKECPKWRIDLSK